MAQAQRLTDPQDGGPRWGMKSARGRDAVRLIAVPSSAEAVRRESQRRLRPPGLRGALVRVLLPPRAEAIGGVSPGSRATASWSTARI